MSMIRLGFPSLMLLAGWILSPYAFYAISALFPTIKSGYTVNIHLFGTTRWLWVVSVILSWHFLRQLHNGLDFKLNPLFRLVLLNFAIALVISVATDIQLWLPSSITMLPLTPLAMNKVALFEVPFRLIIFISNIPVGLDSHGYWAIGDILHVILLLYALWIIVLFTVIHIIHDNISKVHTIRKHYEYLFIIICFICFILNWVQMIPFPFENSYILYYFLFLSIVYIFAILFSSRLYGKLMVAIADRIRNDFNRMH